MSKITVAILLGCMMVLFAIGAAHAGVGTIGDAGTFSFDFVKTMTCGEGGVVITNRQDIYEKCDAYSDHGHDPDAAGRGVSRGLSDAGAPQDDGQHRSSSNDGPWRHADAERDEKKQDSDNDEPRCRSCTQSRQKRKAGDPEHRAADVERIGAERSH